MGNDLLPYYQVTAVTIIKCGVFAQASRVRGDDRGVASVGRSIKGMESFCELNYLCLGGVEVED